MNDVVYLLSPWDVELVGWIGLSAGAGVWHFFKFRREKRERTGRDGKSLVVIAMAVCTLVGLAVVFLYRAQGRGEPYLVITPDYVVCGNWGQGGWAPYAELPWSNVRSFSPPETAWWARTWLPGWRYETIRFSLFRPLSWQDKDTVRTPPRAQCYVSGLTGEPEQIYKDLILMRSLARHPG